MKEKGMLDQADDFFYTSGKLSVQCYKEELEAAARTKLLAGYQILDIQDFSGQGTALVVFWMPLWTAKDMLHRRNGQDTVPTTFC